MMSIAAIPWLIALSLLLYVNQLNATTINSTLAPYVSLGYGGNSSIQGLQTASQWIPAPGIGALIEVVVCCRPSSCSQYDNTCCSSAPTMLTVTLPSGSVARYDAGKSQTAPIYLEYLEFESNVNDIRFRFTPMSRVRGGLQYDNSVEVTFSGACGNNLNQRFSWFAEPPYYNPAPTVDWWSSGVVANGGTASPALQSEVSVMWHNVSAYPGAPGEWHAGALQILKKGSYREFTVQYPNGPQVIRFWKAEENRFDRYHGISTEVVFPNRILPINNTAHIYDTLQYLVMHPCYLGPYSEVFPIIEYKEHLMYETYLVAKWYWTNFPGKPPKDSDWYQYVPISSAQWNYSTTATLVNSQWQVTKGAVTVQSLSHPDVDLPEWSGLTQNILRTAGDAPHPDGNGSKCYCQQGSLGCSLQFTTRRMEMSQSNIIQQEILNPWADI